MLLSGERPRSSAESWISSTASSLARRTETHGGAWCVRGPSRHGRQATSSLEADAGVARDLAFVELATAVKQERRRLQGAQDPRHRLELLPTRQEDHGVDLLEALLQ